MTVNNRSKSNLIFNIFGLSLGLGYLCLYINDIRPFWFNPQWVTDDALQQIYPFYKVYHPQIFQGDLITEVMEGYLAPLHYYLSYFLTWLTGDPIMMSHYVMLIQLLLTLIFFFLIVKNLTNTGMAGIALFWMVHTRTFMQRITGGLPRGWAAAILCMCIYFIIKKNHKAVLVVLLAGCLLNPPATVIAAGTYGLYLLFNLFSKESRAVYKKPFLTLLFLSPVYILITFQVVKRPDHIGQMVTYKQALEMPSMTRPHGRFPFVPLLDVPTELKMYAFQPLRHRLVRADKFIKENAVSVFKFFKDQGQIIYLILILLLLTIFWLKKKRKLPTAITAYFLSIVTVYFLSRLLAFNLYVPDRHLQQPLTIFWIILILFLICEVRRLALVPLFILIYLCNGHGFFGSSNFNYSLYKKGKVFEWIKNNTAEDAIIAGHPQHIDALMLFGMRKAYVTYETSHPFYPKYFKAMLKRNEVSLRAHYAKDLNQVYELLADKDVDYFVFDRYRFYPDKLAKEKYFEPLRPLVKELTSRHYTDYAYKLLPKNINLTQAPYMLFRDDRSVLIDIAKLREFLEANENNK